MAIEFRRDGPWELPRGWVWAQLGEIGEIVGGTTVDKNRRPIDPITLPYLRVANVQRGHLLLDKIKTVTVERKVGEALALQPGDILLNEGGDRDKIGRGWVWEGQIPQCIHQNHVFRVRLRDTSLNPYFISYFANEFGRTFFMAEGKQTTNLASISMSKIRQLPVPIAPIAEQRRIVKRIDELFSEIADGETALTRARADLDTWRRALLKTAVTGELTREWRENNAPNQSGAEVLATAQALRSHFGARKGALSEKNVKAPTNWLDLPEIPSGWIWAKLSDFAWASSYGTSAKCSPDAGGMAVLRIPNIQDGRINLQNLKRATIDLEIPQQEALAPGDILVVRTNGSADLIGRAALISSPLAETTYFASYLIRFRIVANELIQKWISLFLSSPVARAWVHKNIASSAGQYNISQSALMALPIPVPPFIEMRQALEVSTQLDSIRRDTETEANQAQAGRHILTQSILKAAFAGLLVDQDPRDEPADSLLSRLSSPIAGAARAPISRAGRTSKAAQ